MEVKEYHVEGMSCQHCVKAVEGALHSLAGVKAAKVNLEAKRVHVEYDPSQVTDETMKDAIEEQGYDVVE